MYVRIYAVTQCLHVIFVSLNQMWFIVWYVCVSVCPTVNQISQKVSYQSAYVLVGIFPWTEGGSDSILRKITLG